MKKLTKREKQTIYVTEEASIECDFCGVPNDKVFTSEYDAEPRCGCKCEMQICHNCVDQLSTLLNNVKVKLG